MHPHSAIGWQAPFPPSFYDPHPYAYERPDEGRRRRPPGMGRPGRGRPGAQRCANPGLQLQGAALCFIGVGGVSAARECACHHRANGTRWAAGPRPMSPGHFICMRRPRRPPAAHQASWDPRGVATNCTGLGWEPGASPHPQAPLPTSALPTAPHPSAGPDARARAHLWRHDNRLCRPELLRG